MSTRFYLVKAVLWILSFVIINGCAPLVPDNYLGPSNIQTPVKIDGKWVTPKLTLINAKMLNSAEGRALLVPIMQPQAYRVGPFDTLNIIVWGHPDISTVATGASPSMAALSSLGNNIVMSSSASNPAVSVQIDGTIFYPYVGHLKVSGLTINEIQNAIAKRLATYIRHPQITVQIAQFQNRHIYVLGEVMKTGAQPITDRPLTLMEAVSTAGGINTNSADPTHIYVVRGSYLKPDIFLLNAQSPQALLITERFPLQENDIVYVSSATLNSFNKFMQTVFPTFTTYWTIKGLSQS